MLLNDGYTLKDVQEYMGHADIQMTADLYGHLDMARKDMLSNHLANRIFSDPDAKVIELGIAANPWNNCVSSHGDAKMIEKNVKIARNASKGDFARK